MLGSCAINSQVITTKSHLVEHNNFANSADIPPMCGCQLPGLADADLRMRNARFT
jgi:hypothetical protein